MNGNFIEKPLRPDAEPIRWLKSKKAWYGIYHEFRTKADPPMAMLTDWAEAPKKELSKLREIKKAEVAQRLGLHLTKDYLLSTLSEKYLKGIESKNTLETYSTSLKYLKEACGDFDLRNWDQSHEISFTKYLKELKKPNGSRKLNEGGVNTHQRQLQWFLNWITNKRIVPKFTYWRIDKEQIPPWENEIFTRDEIKEYRRLVTEYGNPIFIRAWYLAYYALMRAEEIITLPANRINLNSLKIQISKVEELNWHPKQFIQRYMGIHPELEKFLKKDLAENPRVWYLDRFGKPHYSEAENLSQAFTRLRDKHFKWDRKIEMLQALRRTGITHLVEAGKGIQDVKYLAGHQKLATTEKYYLFVDKQRATENVNF